MAAFCGGSICNNFVACCVLCAALIPPFGMMGAAIVSSICMIQGRVSFALAVRRVLPRLFACP